MKYTKIVKCLKCGAFITKAYGNSLFLSMTGIDFCPNCGQDFGGRTGTFDSYANLKIIKAKRKSGFLGWLFDLYEEIK